MPRYYAYILAALVFVLDQLTKQYFLKLFTPQPYIMEVTSFLNFRVVWNHGVTFGLFQANSMTGAYVLSGIMAAVVILVLVWLQRTAYRPAIIGYGLIIGGALGNIVDRLRFGAVFDFIDVHVAGWHYPTFNVADMSIVCGVGILLLWGMQKPVKKTA